MAELYHHGIKGQKWGVRRYQNKDGSLTPSGKKRYNSDDPIKNKVNDSKSTKKRKTMSKAEKDKEDIKRMIKALDDHQKSMKASVLTTTATAAARATGHDYVSSFLEGSGRTYVSHLSANSGYDFWR